MPNPPHDSLSSLLAEHIEHHFARHRTAPITTSATPQLIRRHLHEVYGFAQPMEPRQVFEDVTAMLWQWAEHATNPMHFGLTRPTVDEVSVVADALVALYDPNLAMWELSPAAVEMEKHVLALISRHLGLDPESSFASFTTGGQEANHTATVVALSHRFPQIVQNGLRALPGLPVLYLSAQGHHSFDKIANSTGLGRGALRFVPVDRDLKMDIQSLQQAIETDLRQGCVPFMIVGTAGTTGAGVVDPLSDLRALAHEHGLWFHVDAAWGGAAALSPKLRPILAGIELADSTTFDAHKWLSVPVGAGMFFCRHSQPVHRSFRTGGPYLPQLADDGRDYPLFSSMQWSRRFIGLKLFMMLATRGLQGLVDRIERQAELGEHLRRRLRDSSWRLLNRTPLPVVCFTHESLDASRAAHDEIVSRLKLSQTAWISRIDLGDSAGESRIGLRASITNFNSQAEDVDRLVAALDAALPARQAQRAS